MCSSSENKLDTSSQKDTASLASIQEKEADTPDSAASDESPGNSDDVSKIDDDVKWIEEEEQKG